MPQANAVVDLSHHNGVVDLARAKNDQILGVIHKATQGTSYTDGKYDINRRQASDAGLFWGAYLPASLVEIRSGRRDRLRDRQ